MTNEDLLLVGMMEECAELIQACSKVKRFGISSHNPNTNEANIDLLKNEIGDTAAHIVLLCHFYGIDDTDVDERAQFKIKKFTKRHAENFAQ